MFFVIKCKLLQKIWIQLSHAVPRFEDEDDFFYCGIIFCNFPSLMFWKLTLTRTTHQKESGSVQFRADVAGFLFFNDRGVVVHDLRDAYIEIARRLTLS